MLFRYSNCMQSILDGIASFFPLLTPSRALCVFVCMFVCTFWWLLLSFNNCKKQLGKKNMCCVYMPIYYSVYANVWALCKNKMIKKFTCIPSLAVFKLKYMHTQSHSQHARTKHMSMFKRKLGSFHSVIECYRC